MGQDTINTREQLEPQICFELRDHILKKSFFILQEMAKLFSALFKTTVLAAGFGLDSINNFGNVHFQWTQDGAQAGAAIVEALVAKTGMLTQKKGPCEEKKKYNYGQFSFHCRDFRILSSHIGQTIMNRVTKLSDIAG